MTTTDEKAAELRLAPCPFCGGEARLQEQPERSVRHGVGWVSRWIECLLCEAQTRPFPTAAEAIAAWSRRSPALDAAPVMILELLTDAAHSDRSDENVRHMLRELLNEPTMKSLRARRRAVESAPAPKDEETYRMGCTVCHKSATSPLPKDATIRAVLVCPECIEEGRTVFPDVATPAPAPVVDAQKLAEKVFTSLHVDFPDNAEMLARVEEIIAAEVTNTGAPTHACCFPAHKAEAGVVPHSCCTVLHSAAELEGRRE